MRSFGMKAALSTIFATSVASLGIVAVPLPAAIAAPPSNDSFANAQVIAGYGVTTGTNVEATREAGEPQHSGYPDGASVWYSWTAGAGAPDVVIEITQADFDPNLAVYTGSSVNALTSIEFDDDAGLDVLPKIELNPTDGTTYYIAVDACCGGFDTIDPGSFKLRLREAQAATPGTISGTVTRTNPADLSGPAIAAEDICVIALDTSGDAIGSSATTNASGAYSFSPPPGTYYLQFRNCGSANVAGEYYPDAQTLGAASTVTVTGTGDQTVNALLGVGGTISGTLTVDGGPILGVDVEDVCVRAVMVGGSDSGVARTTTTDSSGNYTLTGLDGGDYRIRFGGDRVFSCGADNVQFETEYYNDVSTTAAATLVTVTEGAANDIDADLMAVPGAISGTVTALAGGAPLENICVRTKSPVESAYVFTSATGTYTIPNVAAGSSWVVEFRDCNTVGSYTTQYYDAQLVLDDADEIQVLAGQTTTAINAQMFVALDFSGTILDENGNGRSPACVNVHTENGATVTSAETNNDGEWSASVPPGSYDFEMKDCGAGGLEFETRWYLDALSQGDADKFSASQAGMNQVLPGVPGTSGRIVGTVAEDSTGAPELEGICVTADGPGPQQETTTDADGNYEFGGIQAGSYTVFFQQCEQFAPYSVQSQYWNGVPVGGTPTNVVVTSGNTTAGINALMVPGGTIEGVVTNEDGTLPLEDICVTAYLDPDDPYPSFVQERFTNADGEYRLVGLPTDVYFLTYEDCNYVYAGQWYHGVPFTNQVDITPVGDPTPISVTAGDTEVVDPTRLLRYATISGTITNEDGDPLENVCVGVDSPDPDVIPMQVYTDENGDYLLPELFGTTGPDDEYRVVFFGCLPPTTDYGQEFWDNQLSETTADLIAVEMGEQLTGIDAVLQDEVPANITAPDVLGQASVGMTLKAGNGTWDHEPSVFSFQWYRCDAAGTNCQVANDGTERRYLISEDDEGYRFQVEVTATNSKGDGTAMSALTAVVDDAAPANDDFADAVELGNALPLDVFGSNVRATRQVGEPKHLGYPIGASVWYEWTAPTVSPVEALRISLDGSSYETTLSVYEGPATLPDLELVAEDNGSGMNGESVLTFYPDPGTTYYIAVDGNFDGSEIQTGAIEMRLSAGSGITGTVLDDDSDPIRSICVTAEDPDDPTIYYEAFTAADGTYYVDAPAGEYIVSFTDCVMEYEDQYYDGVPDFEDATPVVVVDGEVTRDIDATLVTAVTVGSISGTVTDEDGDPIPNICVIPVSLDYGPQVLSMDCTDQDGTYLLRGLGDPDSDDELEYYVWFDDCSCFWGSELYDNAIDPDDAVVLSVSRNDHITDIDATLQYLPPANTALPQVSGGSNVGATLAISNGTWAHEPSVFAYQWMRCNASGGSCVEIAGAEGSTYVTVGADAGSKIRVEVTASNSVGDTTVLSLSNGAVIGVPTNSTAPVISGTPAVGQVLSVTTGTWTGSPTSYSYQWLQCDANGASCTTIPSATANSYTVQAGDTGFRLRAAVTATNTAGNSVPKNAGATGIIGAPINTALPAVSGSGAIGANLTVSTGTWSGSPTSYTYQWMRCDNTGSNCLVIAGAQSSGYTTTVSDAGYKLRVEVTAINGAGGTTVLSLSNGTIVGAPTSINPPVVSGTVAVGEVLSTTNGTWTGSPTGYSYQWLRCNGSGESCTPIPSAQSDTYTIQSADNGYRLRAAVSATNGIGTGGPRNSAATAAVGTPVNTSLPAVTGSPSVGATLTVSTGTWTGSPTSYGYQWMRCDSSGANCNPIAGEQANTYVTTGSDSGSKMRVNVTATNGAGSTTVLSTSNGVIAVPNSIGAPEPMLWPFVTGPATVGGTLTVHDGSWTGDPTSYTYQWMRCDAAGFSCTPIGGAQAGTYVTTGADAGSKIRVNVTATNVVTSSTALAFSNGSVIGVPVNTTAPALSGTAAVGQELTLSNGTWTGANSYSYQWLRCDTNGLSCSLIPGALSNSYTVQADDTGFRLRGAVTTTNTVGSTTRNSGATLVVGAPVNTVQPSISGTAAVGSTLTGNVGVWTGSGITFGFQWMRCNSAGIDCAAIGGAQSATYQLVGADSGNKVRVNVTATNTAGATTVLSLSNGVIP